MFGFTFTNILCIIKLNYNINLFFVQTLLFVMVLTLLSVHVVRCALRSHQWRSEQSLFISALSICPLNAKVNNF